jgi:hypothetical protein
MAEKSCWPKNGERIPFFSELNNEISPSIGICFPSTQYSYSVLSSRQNGRHVFLTGCFQAFAICFRSTRVDFRRFGVPYDHGNALVRLLGYLLSENKSHNFMNSEPSDGESAGA